MNNNSAIAVFMTLLLSCLYIFNQNTIESFWNISGSKMSSAYLPQQRKDNLSIPNYSPQGSSSRDGANRDLETFNYNPQPIRSNMLSPSVEDEFNKIEQFQMKNENNAPTFNQTDYNTRSPQSLPAQTLSDTHIPMREDYQKAKGVGVAKVTPNKYRNGAKPLAGAGLLRGEVPIRENFSSGSTPQFGSYGQPAGNIQKRGGREVANARGNVDIVQDYALGMQFNAKNIGSVLNPTSENFTAALPRRARDAMMNEPYTAALPRRVRDAIPVGQRAEVQQQYTSLLPQSNEPQVMQQYDMLLPQQYTGHEEDKVVTL
jgi:hypothetical protein